MSCVYSPPLLFLGVAKEPGLVCIFSISDVNHEMDCRTAWLGVHPPVQPVIPRYTVHERALYFKSTFFWWLSTRESSVHLSIPFFSPYWNLLG